MIKRRKLTVGLTISLVIALSFVAGVFAAENWLNFEGEQQAEDTKDNIESIMDIMDNLNDGKISAESAKKELEKDMNIKFDELKVIEHNHPLDRKDIKSALETFDREYYNFTIDDIVKLTDIRIEKSKRNYRNQNTHLKLARGQLAILREMEEGQIGRPKGTGTKEETVKKYISENPEANPTEIARKLGISRSTAYKYMK